MNIIKLFLMLTWKFTLAIGTLAWWAVHAVHLSVRAGRFHARSRKAEQSGVFCPAGHRLVELSTWQCSCGFVWRGSGWHCPGPTCAAPSSAYLPCSEPGCPLSVRSPHIDF